EGPFLDRRYASPAWKLTGDRLHMQGWPASGPGRLLPGPWFLTGGGAVAPTLKGRVPKMLSAKRFERIFGCPLTVEGDPRTLSGPSPAPSLTPALCLPLGWTIIEWQITKPLTSRYAQVYRPATSDAVQQPGRPKGEGQ